MPPFVVMEMLIGKVRLCMQHESNCGRRLLLLLPVNHIDNDIVRIYDWCSPGVSVVNANAA